MRRVFNLQRDPDSGELFAIGKSDRPYAFDEIRAFEQAAAAGDARTIAALVPTQEQDDTLAGNYDGRGVQGNCSEKSDRYFSVY